MVKGHLIVLKITQHLDPVLMK